MTESPRRKITSSFSDCVRHYEIHGIGNTTFISFEIQEFECAVNKHGIRYLCIQNVENRRTRGDSQIAVHAIFKTDK